MINHCTYLGHSPHACGQPTVLGKSYCAEHIYTVYQKGTARGRRNKDQRRVDTVRWIEQLMMEVIAELEAEGFDCYAAREVDLDQV